MEPALILGLNGAPAAGDTFHVVESDQEAREITNKREQLARERHDGVVVVARSAEFFAQLLQPDARRHGEAADPIAFRGDEVRQREVFLPAGLVAEHRQAVFAALGVCFGIY